MNSEGAPARRGLVKEMVDAHGELLLVDLQGEARRLVFIALWSIALVIGAFILLQTLLIATLIFAWERYRYIGLGAVAAISMVCCLIARWRLAGWTKRPFLRDSMVELRRTWRSLR